MSTRELLKGVTGHPSLKENLHIKLYQKYIEEMCLRLPWLSYMIWGQVSVSTCIRQDKRKTCKRNEVYAPLTSWGHASMMQ